MPLGVLIALLGLAGVLLTAIGALVGAVLTNRTRKREIAVQAKAHQKSAENDLIDQLQEELKQHRTEQATRAAAQEERMTEQERRMSALEDRNHDLMRERDGYRDHAHALRSHIWDGKPPPPPEWPPGLPR